MCIPTNKTELLIPQAMYDQFQNTEHKDAFKKMVDAHNKLWNKGGNSFKKGKRTADVLGDTQVVLYTPPDGSPKTMKDIAD
eukprot:9226496-Alexandrium_andersonii.AAC.1